MAFCLIELRSLQSNPHLMISLHKPSEFASPVARSALSAGIDNLPMVMDIVRQSSVAGLAYAHAVRIVRLSAQMLARGSYSAYLEYRDAMRRMMPSFTDTGTQMLWVPVYCAYLVEYLGEHSRWVVVKWREGPFAVGSAARPKRNEAVREAQAFLDAYRSKAPMSIPDGVLVGRDWEPPLQWFVSGPLVSDPNAAALEAVWRTVKQTYPNEVALAELAI
jgi:hypothetical protein